MEMDKEKNLIGMNKIYVILTSIILLGLTYIFYFNISNDLKIFNFITVMGILIFGFFIISWYMLEKEFVSLYIFFILFSFLFYFGQPVAYLINDENLKLSVYSIKLFSNEVINETLMYVLTLYVIIHVVAILFKKPKQKIEKFKLSQANRQAMNYVGLILLVLSFIPNVILLLNSFNAVQSAGYIGLFTIPNTIATKTGFLGISSGFIIPALFMLILANIDNKSKRLIYLGMFLVYILLLFALGRRGENSIYLIALILIWHNLVKPIKGKRFLQLTLYGVLALFAMSVISQVRSSLNEGNIFSLMISVIGDIDLKQFITDIITEYGITLLVPLTIIDNIPSDISFNYGLSYFNAILVMIPNIFWDINPGLINGTLEALTSPYIRTGVVGGIGSSYVAELYYNFGYFSYLLAPLITYILIKTHNYINLRNNKVSALNYFFMIYFFTNLFWLIRSEVLTMGKEVIYFGVFPLFLAKIVSIYLEKNNRKLGM